MAESWQDQPWRDHQQGILKFGWPSSYGLQRLGYVVRTRFQMRHSMPETTGVPWSLELLTIDVNFYRRRQPRLLRAEYEDQVVTAAQVRQAMMA